MILIGDTDRDGQVNYEEFMAEMAESVERAKQTDTDSDHEDDESNIFHHILNNELFDYIDEDNNGSISFAEFSNSAFNNTFEEMTNYFGKDTTKYHFSVLDDDGDGHLNFQEIVDLISNDENRLSNEKLFSLIDRDGNGLISFSEAKHASTIYGEQETDEEIKEELRKADIDGDGHVNFEELVARME